MIDSLIMNYALYIMNWIVVPGRLELPTSTLSVWRSNQLSYRTVKQFALPFASFISKKQMA